MGVRVGSGLRFGDPTPTHADHYWQQKCKWMHLVQSKFWGATTHSILNLSEFGLLWSLRIVFKNILQQRFCVTLAVLLSLRDFFDDSVLGLAPPRAGG